MGNRPVVFKDNAANGFEFGNCILFDGVDDYINFSNVTLSGDFTINAWINLISTSTAQYCAIVNYSTGLSGFAIRKSDKLLYFRVEGQPPFSPVYPSNWNFGGWNMLSATRESGLLKLFTNGVKQGEGTFNGNMRINQTGDTWFNPPQNYMLDEIGWANVAISEADVFNLFNNENGQFLTKFCTPLSYFRCNQSGAQSFLIDEMGNNNGTLINFAAPPPEYFVPHV